MNTRVSYKTFVIERPVAASRELTWQALLDVVSGPGYQTQGDPAPHGPGSTVAFRLDGRDLLERTLSLEPPWRRVYTMVEGAPVNLYEGTITIREDRNGCLLVWSYLADPGEDPEADAFLERAKDALRTATELVAVAAERAAAPPT